MRYTSDDLLADPQALGMQHHPEGGWYRETWRHEDTVQTERGERALATCVSFLLLPDDKSAWHRVASAEMWLWQGGGPVRLLIGGDGSLPAAEPEVHVLGTGAQYLVPPGVWQAAEPATHRASLVGCVVSPGFDFEDFWLAPSADETSS